MKYKLIEIPIMTLQTCSLLTDNSSALCAGIPLGETRNMNYRMKYTLADNTEILLEYL